ncbi:hypothetical protein LguiA_022429 [Lonicera macranthoides]
MASGTTVGDNGGNEASKEKQKWTDSKVYTRKSFKGLKNEISNKLGQLQTQTLALEDANSSQQLVVDDSSSLIRAQVDASAGNGAMKLGFPALENRVTINLSSRSKKEMRELRRKLQSELDMVRDFVKKIDSKEGEKEMARSTVNKGGLKRVRSEVGSVGSVGPPQESRPLHQLSISVLENSQGVSDNVEKEKRTPKANQFYRNSEFLLAKDKFPPAEGNKKSKSNGKKQGGVDGFGLGKFSNQAFKSCTALLERLMKHKHGWVFNSPVDANALGLHDYFTIIKHPMDLGTVKSRLSKNWYKSPREFAEDVRLTFDNAMTYNPKGQDVHVMAEQLSKIFEEKWTVIETDYMRELRLAVDLDSNLSTPTSRKTLTPRVPPHEMIRPFDHKSKKASFTHSGRTAAPKKPKAKDPNKREMTYQEKQKLSTNLQSLPSEKLNDIVQIIKKRNTSLSQHDDEIEVDIDSFDTETLWELDRFVTNFKKSLSKNKRKAEMASKATTDDVQNVLEKNPDPVAVETDASKETKTDEKDNSAPTPNQVENQTGDASGSSSSSSSSSDSGSSSSGSDSGSSSGNESEAGRSPKT